MPSVHNFPACGKVQGSQAKADDTENLPTPGASLASLQPQTDEATFQAFKQQKSWSFVKKELLLACHYMEPKS